MPELSPAFRQLLERCASCGGPMPCALHDAELREAILHPPEREGLPWDVLERREILAHVGILALERLAHGVLVVADNTQRITAYDLRNPEGERAQELRGSGRLINALQALPDGTFLMGGTEGVFRCDPAKPEQQRFEKLGVYDHGRTIYDLRPLDDHTYLVVGAGGSIAQVDLTKPDGERMSEIADFREDIYRIHSLPDGAFVIMTFGGRIVRFAQGDGGVWSKETLKDFSVEAYGFSGLSDGTFLVGLADGSIVRLDPAKPAGERVQKIVDFGGTVWCIVPTSDHSFLVGGMYGVTEFSIPEHILRAHRERKLHGPETPPMPE